MIDIEENNLIPNQYKFDTELNIFPPIPSWKPLKPEVNREISCYPYLNEFINLSFIAYKDHVKTLTSALNTLFDAYKTLISKVEGSSDKYRGDYLKSKPVITIIINQINY